MKFYTNVYQRGNKIYLRGYNGTERVSKVINYKPYMFLPAKKNAQTEFHTLDGKPVEKLLFDSISDARDFVKRYDDVANFEVYGLNDFKYLFIYDEYHGDIQYDPSKINIISLDIETDSSGGFPDILKADKEVTAITISRRGEKVVFGLKPYKPKSDKITYIHCKDEYELLSKFLHVWQSGRFSPDIVTGWNIEFFDIPYLVNRITNVLGVKDAEKLSPWGILIENSVEIRGKTNQTFTPAGINVLDYYHLYRKFSFSNHENYKLDTIAEEELGVKKLDYSQYGSLNDLYVKNFELFIDYNIRDVEMIDMFEEKLKFIELVVALAYRAKVNYNDMFTTVRPWDVIIHNYLLDRAIVIHQFKKGKSLQSLMGGHVKDVKTGMNCWVVSFDLDGLYPHLIMGYNISPDTYVMREESSPSIDAILNGKLSFTDDYTYAANGTRYRRDKQGFLAALMESIYNERVEFKQKMLDAKKQLETIPETENEKRRLVSNEISRYHNRQLAMKILLNSAYGALANEYFRWFDFNLAEAITSSGQLTIRWIEMKINGYLNKVLNTSNVDYVIASDTDSAYIEMNNLVQTLDETDPVRITKILDAFCERKIKPFMDKAYQELADYVNAYQQKMRMKRETIADKGIWKAKKMYILNAWNIEGVQYSEPKLKIQGIEAVRSSTPKVCRKNIKTVLEMIMNKDEESVQQYISDFKKYFITLPFEEVAFPRGMNNIDKYTDKNSIYASGTPIQVRGALLFNNLLKEKNLLDKYMTIGDGDKIKFAYLKVPNPIRENVIAVLDDLPKEFGLEKYIDYDTQFEKTFVEPIKGILDVIGWSVEKRNTLMNFFG